jgi:hypothetical protein
MVRLTIDVFLYFQREFCNSIGEKVIDADMYEEGHVTCWIWTRKRSS